MKTSDIMNTLVAGFLDGKAGLKATEAIPAGSTVGVNWESGEVFVEKRGMDSRRPGPVKEYVEPDFRALNETAERVKDNPKGYGKVFSFPKDETDLVASTQCKKCGTIFPFHELLGHENECPHCKKRGCMGIIELQLKRDFKPFGDTGLSHIMTKPPGTILED